MTEDNQPQLSVVATSRNDDHGKNLLYRMQTFVDVFVEQCKKHNLHAELILVEWNPPDNKLPLAQALRFPADKGPCKVRIIRVPKEAHSKLDHSDKIPLYQMIGKNVGIRRARGKFVLATNIDVLFSDKIIQYMKNKLSGNVLYRVDRLDVPEKLPDSSTDDILHFCSKNFFRVNSKFGSFPAKPERIGEKFKRWAKRIRKLTLYLLKLTIKLIVNISIINICRACTKFCKAIGNLLIHFSIRNLLINYIPTVYYQMKGSKLYKKFAPRLKNISYRLFPSSYKFMHTNACGDFTLLSYQDWMQLKGYPEWCMYSWHLDSLLLYQAKQHGIKERDLPKPFSVYHIDHEIGSGYSPEGANLLFKRLNDRGIPYLSNRDLDNFRDSLKKSKEKVVYNADDWGMAGLGLEDVSV